MGGVGVDLRALFQVIDDSSGSRVGLEIAVARAEANRSIYQFNQLPGRSLVVMSARVSTYTSAAGLCVYILSKTGEFPVMRIGIATFINRQLLAYAPSSIPSHFERFDKRFTGRENWTLGQKWILAQKWRLVLL